MSVQITRRLPDLLRRLNAPIPYVIGTYLDAIRDQDPDSTRRLTTEIFWVDINKSNDVLLCSPVEGISAKFILNYIKNHTSKPPSEDIWKELSNAKYWVRRMSISKVFL